MITMIVTKMIMTVTLKGMEGCGGNLGGMGDHNLSELLLCLYLYLYLYLCLYLCSCMCGRESKEWGDGRRDGRR